MSRGSRHRTEAASVPPPGLPGLDPRWSRLVRISDLDGIPRTFHVLDSWAARDGTDPAVSDEADPAVSDEADPAVSDEADPAVSDEPIGTLLCVHGNPTWSYLWRRLLAAAPAGWRVVAPDQLGMGYSDRIGRRRLAAERVDDLGRLTDALGITGPGKSGPVVTVAHDWGGIISLGWGQQHVAQLRGAVLTNTAVHQPDETRGPLLIRLAHLPALNRIACRWTPLFVRATTSLTWPRLPREVRDAFASPYRTPARRVAVADFVTDIPFAPGHRSHAAVEAIADTMTVTNVPILLLWGPRDPVFTEAHLRDLQDRLPQADLHRYENASHLLTEDAPEYVEAIVGWTARLGEDQPSVLETGGVIGTTSVDDRPSVLARLEERADDESDAVVEIGGRRISWADLSSRVDQIAAGLRAAGLRPGDRAALMVPPSIDLTIALYAVWRAGGVIVVADKGLGVRGMGRALRGARLDYVVAETPGLLASRLMRLPGRRISVGQTSAMTTKVGQVSLTFAGLARAGAGQPVAPDASGDDEAAVLFTSGATGPAKGVLYRHRQVRAQLDLIQRTYGLTGDDRIVAAFAPFALYGPALGVPSVVPRTDVTKPGKLTATALAEAATAIGATVVFASPAALRNVVATSFRLRAPGREALGSVRLLMSAGASVPAPLLREVAKILPNASLHTPYGMTEALPLTDISLTEIEEAGNGDGVCVGRPLVGVRVAIAPLDRNGRPGGELSVSPGSTGEIWASAEHVRDRYDARWATDMAGAEHPGWHRTGDIGYLDQQSRLWVQGRAVHLMTTADGPVTPVGIELRVETALASAGLGAGPGQHAGVAAVGVGPAGAQQVVVVVAGAGGPLASIPVIDLVRRAAGRKVASVLMAKRLPVDIRHNSKIDRVAVGTWAAKVLAGG